MLGAASFRLTRREEGDRVPATASACVPAGVIGCASEPGMLTTNGMSYSRRLPANGNAAFLVPVGPADYPEHPIPALAGVAFQRDMERRAFAAAGGSYAVPAVRLVGFSGRRSPDLPVDCSCPRSFPRIFAPSCRSVVTRTLERTIPGHAEGVERRPTR